MSRDGNNSRYDGPISTDILDGYCKVRGVMDVRRQARRFGAAFGALVAAGILVVSCGGSDAEPAPDKGITCDFSTETTTATIPAGEGIGTLALAIDGVEYGTCEESAKDILEQMNPEQVEYGNLTAVPGVEYTIPRSVSIVTGS